MRDRRNLALALALFLGLSACGGKLVTTIGIPGTEGTAEGNATLAGGSKVDFPVKASTVSGREAANLQLHIEFLQGSKVVGTFDCPGYRVRPEEAAGVWALDEACRTTVPAAGASSLRVTTHLTRTGAATFGGLAVEVRQP